MSQMANDLFRVIPMLSMALLALAAWYEGYVLIQGIAAFIGIVYSTVFLYKEGMFQHD